MSSWTYINGNVTVSPLGRTQAEMRYILETVLSHLPIVSGSERDMSVHIIQKSGHNNYSSVDELGFKTNNLKDDYGRKSKKGWLETQSEYILVVEGKLRDRVFEETLKEFNNWLCRLSKRLMVENVLVKIEGYNKEIILENKNKAYYNMFEYPSWSWYEKDSKNWCEYLLWKEK
jgi:hypothetical protein